MITGNIVVDAALNLECEGFVPESSDTLVYVLPYIWAFALCLSGKREAWMKWFSDTIRDMNLSIDAVIDGKDGEVIFETSPIKEAQSN